MTLRTALTEDNLARILHAGVAANVAQQIRERLQQEADAIVEEASKRLASMVETEIDCMRDIAADRTVVLLRVNNKEVKR